MKEEFYCMICSRKKWEDVTVIELHSDEYKVMGRCAKCGQELIKVIKQDKFPIV